MRTVSMRARRTNGEKGDQMNLTQRVEELLMQVAKPAVYMGGELYSCEKEPGRQI